MNGDIDMIPFRKTYFQNSRILQEDSVWNQTLWNQFQDRDLGVVPYMPKIMLDLESDLGIKLQISLSPPIPPFRKFHKRQCPDTYVLKQLRKPILLGGIPIRNSPSW